MEGLLSEFRLFEPDAVYTSFIRDGFLDMPEECLLHLNSTSLVLTNSYMEGCICLFPPDSFEDVKHELNKLNTMDSQARYIKRRIVGCAEVVGVDSQRQISIKPEFLQTLGLDMSQDTDNNKAVSVVVIKYSNRIEIVSSTVYENAT